MVSTHLFQVLTFVAMEPPVSFEPDRLRDETVKVLRSAEIAGPDRVVRGQYVGYRQEPDVDPESTTETFSAMQLDIDNWRWAGVPFFLRTGKGLADKVSEITLKFHKVPFNVFSGTDMDLPMRSHLTIRVQPNEGITIAFNAKRPGRGMHLDRVAMEFDYAEDFAHARDRGRVRAADPGGDARRRVVVHPAGRRSNGRGRSSSRSSTTRRRSPSTSVGAGVRRRQMR